MKKLLAILCTCLYGILINTTTYAQNIEDSTCKKALLASVKVILDDSILFSPYKEKYDVLKYLDFYAYAQHQGLHNHRLLLFEDRRTKFHEHEGFRGKALINQECEMIVPKHVQQINALVNKEQGWSTLDIALLYMYFNSHKEGLVTFWTKKQYKCCLHKSTLFSIFYSNSDYHHFPAKMLKKECRELFIISDSLVQFVVSPRYDEFLESGNDTIIKNFFEIYKLVTIYFSNERHITKIKQTYFVARLKNDKSLLVFYNDLASLQKSENLKLN